MKVMCIGSLQECVPPGFPRPEVGDIDTVIDQRQFQLWGTYYNLERFPGDLWWNADKFAPLSEIDETELVNEEKEQYA